MLTSFLLRKRPMKPYNSSKNSTGLELSGFARWSRGGWWSSDCVLDCQVRGPRFKLRPGQKFGSKFLFHWHPYSACWTASQLIPPRVPSLELPCGEEEGVERKGGDTSFGQQKHDRNPTTKDQKRRPENTKTKKNAKKKHWTHWGSVPRG